MRQVPFVLLVVVALSSGARGDEARAKLRSQDPAARAEAYRELDTLPAEERERHLNDLEREHAKWTDRFAEAARAVGKLLSGCEKRRDEKEALCTRWEQAARDAVASVFDYEVFPSPTEAVRGPYIGYYEVMPKVGAAREAYAQIRAQVDKDLRRLRKARPAQVEKLWAALVEADARLQEMEGPLAKHGRAPDPGGGLSRFHLGMLCLKRAEWQGAARIFQGPGKTRRPRTQAAPQPAGRLAVPPGPPLSGLDRVLFFFFYAGLVDDYNDQVEAPCNARARAAVATLNDYRTGMGIHPLQIHPAVTRAIVKHLETVRDVQHEGFTPETRAASQRVALAGYPGRGCGENLSSFCITEAVEKWKWDGGHHRILLLPRAVHVGLCDEPVVGMDVAYGDPPAMPVLCCIHHR